MLFWGQHGVSKDPAAAVKWFERSAVQMKDPSALYDYSILLMKVLRDVKKKRKRKKANLFHNHIKLWILYLHIPPL